MSSLKKWKWPLITLVGWRRWQHVKPGHQVVLPNLQPGTPATFHIYLGA